MSKSNGKATEGFAAFAPFAQLQSESFGGGFERAMTMFGELGELNRSGFEAFGEAARAASDGMKALSERTVSFMKDSMESGIEASKAMSSAKSFQEVLEYQANFAKTAMEKYSAEAGEVVSLMSATARETAAPLNSHFGAVVEKLQASA